MNKKNSDIPAPCNPAMKSPNQMLRLLFVLVLLSPVFTQITSAQQTTRLTFDGLMPVDSAQGTAAYINPETDFSVYTRVMLLEPHVAFRSNWQRDQNRRRSRNIDARDMTRIRNDTATFFRQIFAQNLQLNDGYEVVDEVDYDVLILRPAIIDLDIRSPDVAASGRTQNYTASLGSATLYIELFDAVSGQIVGRATDRQIARGGAGTVSWNSRTTNRAEGRRIFNAWAQQLRAFLDQHYAIK